MKYFLFTLALGIACFFLGDLDEVITRPYKKPEHIYCAGDRFICPDGTQVWRYPPDCEFGACPIAE